MIEFTISTDKDKLDLHVIHDYLCNRSYWAKNRTYDVVKCSIENSLCFGMYDVDGKLIGFARVLTDFAVFSYIMDLFILEEYRRKGLGKRLMEFIMRYPKLMKVERIMLATKDAHGYGKKLIDAIMNHDQLKIPQRWGLATEDAHGLYEKFGFKLTEHADKIMDLAQKK